MATQQRSSVLRFQLESVEGPGVEIGRGSYAVVEEYDFQGLTCVGKSIHQNLYDSASARERETMLERFEGECDMLSRLRHPHIVQFLGVHFKEGSPLPVLLMEQLDSTLAACVDRYGRLPDESCYSVLRDVAVGLRYLHGHTPSPIVHRDLTANNVLLTPDLTAKISDLGVAKILNLSPARMTQMTTCPGTPSYMPPEALVARPIYSTKMDIFAYGNLMTHVFCGRWPIPAEIFRANPSNPNDMMALTEVQRREEYFNDIGEAHPLMDLMRQCLSNNPTIRPDIPEVLRTVKEVMPQFPCAFENKVEVLQRIQADATDKDSLNTQVSNLSTQVEQKADQVRDLLTQIEQKENQLCILSNEKTTLNNQVRDLSTQIEQKERQLRALSAHLEQLQKRTEEQTETLTAVHGLEVDGLRVSLDELRAEAESLRAAVRAKEERLSAKEQEIEAAQDIIKANEQELALKSQDVAAKEQQRKEEVAAKQQEIEAGQVIIRAKNKEIEAAQDIIEAKEQQRKEEVAAKQEEIEAAARAIIRAKNKEIEAAQDIISSKEQQRKQEVAAKDQQLSAKDRLLSAKDRDISSLRMEVTSKDATLQAKESTITSLRNQATQVQILLQQIKSLSDENAALSKRMASLTIESVPVQGRISESQLLESQSKVRWRRGADLPVAMYRPHLVRIGHYIYCGGGGTGQVDTDYLVFKYDTTTDTWSPLPRCPCRNHGLSTFNGELVSTGGIHLDSPTATPTNTVYVYQDSNWVTALPPMHTARFYPSTFTYNTHLIVCGGVTSWTSVEQHTCTSTVEMLNSETGQWSTLAPLPFALRWMSFTICDDICYLIGGEDQEGLDLRACSAPLPLLVQSSSQPSPWKLLPNCPCYGSTAAEVGGCVLALGGQKPGSTDGSTDVHLYSQNSKSWRRMTAVNLPIASYYTTSTTLTADSVIVVGGWENPQNDLSTVFILKYEN